MSPELTKQFPLSRVVSFEKMGGLCPGAVSYDKHSWPIVGSRSNAPGGAFPARRFNFEVVRSRMTKPSNDLGARGASRPEMNPVW